MTQGCDCTCTHPPSPQHAVDTCHACCDSAARVTPAMPSLPQPACLPAPWIQVPPPLRRRPARPHRTSSMAGVMISPGASKARLRAAMSLPSKLSSGTQAICSQPHPSRRLSGTMSPLSTYAPIGPIRAAACNAHAAAAPHGTADAVVCGSIDVDMRSRVQCAPAMAACGREHKAVGWLRSCRASCETQIACPVALPGSTKDPNIYSQSEPINNTGEGTWAPPKPPPVRPTPPSSLKVLKPTPPDSSSKPSLPTQVTGECTPGGSAALSKPSRAS